MVGHLLILFTLLFSFNALAADEEMTGLMRCYGSVLKYASYTWFGNGPDYLNQDSDTFVIPAKMVDSKLTGYIVYSEGRIDRYVPKSGEKTGRFVIKRDGFPDVPILHTPDRWAGKWENFSANAKSLVAPETLEFAGAVPDREKAYQKLVSLVNDRIPKVESFFAINRKRAAHERLKSLEHCNNLHDPQIAASTLRAQDYLWAILGVPLHLQLEAKAPVEK